MELPGEKLLLKLWETIAEKGIGSLLSPWQSKRVGKALAEVRRDELLLITQAEADAADVRAGRKRLLADGRLVSLQTNVTSETGNLSGPIIRTEPTLSFEGLTNKGLSMQLADMVRAEINVCKAVIVAEAALAGDPQSPAEQSVDDDWLFAWRENAGRVSNEDLQRLWGNVLAGEVKSPGRYSIRTLDFLRTLARTDAEDISKIASFVIQGRIIRSQDDYLSASGVSFSFLLRMQELGVVLGVEGIGLRTTFNSIAPDKYIRTLHSHGKALFIKHDDPSKELDLEVYMITKVGQQVLELGQFSADIDYLVQIGKQIIAQGYSVELADWTQVSDGQVRYDNVVAVDGR